MNEKTLSNIIQRLKIEIFSEMQFKYNPYQIIIEKEINEDLVNLYNDFLILQKDKIYKIFANNKIEIKNFSIEIL